MAQTVMRRRFAGQALLNQQLTQLAKDNFYALPLSCAGQIIGGIECTRKFFDLNAVELMLINQISFVRRNHQMGAWIAFGD